MKKYSVNKIISKALMLAVFLLPSMASAEDIEIYFQNKKPKVNLMFVLDTYPSMNNCRDGLRWPCGGRRARIDILKDAMANVMDHLGELNDQDINVGVTALTGSTSGELVRDQEFGRLSRTVGDGTHYMSGAAGGYILYPLSNIHENFEADDVDEQGEVNLIAREDYIASEDVKGNFENGREETFHIPHKRHKRTLTIIKDEYGNWAKNNLTAITFKNLNIPKNAIISEAKLVFDKRTERADGDPRFYAYYSIGSNLEPFNFENNKISDMNWRVLGSDWIVDGQNKLRESAKWKKGGNPFDVSNEGDNENNGLGYSEGYKDTSKIEVPLLRLRERIFNVQHIVQSAINESEWCENADLVLGLRARDVSSSQFWKITTRSTTDNPRLSVKWSLPANAESLQRCLNIEKRIVSKEANAVEINASTISHENAKIINKNNVVVLNVPSVETAREDSIRSVLLNIPLVMNGNARFDKTSPYKDGSFFVEAKVKLMVPGLGKIETREAGSIWDSEAFGDEVTIRGTLVSDSSHKLAHHFRWLKLDVTELAVDKYCENKTEKSNCMPQSATYLLKGWKVLDGNNNEISNLHGLQINFFDGAEVGTEEAEEVIPSPSFNFTIITDERKNHKPKHAEKIKDVIKGLTIPTLLTAEKPVHKGYLEAAKYLLGSTVYFGNDKRYLGTKNECGGELLARIALRRATSHPDSFEEDGLKPLGGCILPRNKSYNNTITKYKPPKPAGLETCEKNAVIIVTDGRWRTATVDDKMAELLSQEPFNLETKEVQEYLFGLVKNTEYSCSGKNVWGRLGQVFDPLSIFDPLSDKEPYLCSALLAEYLNKDTSKKIQTHTVGFMLKADTDENGNRVDASNYADDTKRALISLATAGDGKASFIEEQDSLSEALLGIVREVVHNSASAAAPGIAVDNDTRLEHLNDLYYGLFEPRSTPNWVGNLKKYSLGFVESSPIILDANNNEAIETQIQQDGSEIATGVFKNSAVSYWNKNVVDGNHIDLGGAWGKLKESTTRNLFVTTKSSPKKIINLEAAELSDSDLGVGSSGNNEAEIDRIKEWLTTSWGDLLHSEPRLVSYGKDNNSNVIYVSSNNGFLHAIKASDGTELFAFTPKEELEKASKRLESHHFFNPPFNIVSSEGDGISALDPLRDRDDDKGGTFYGLDSTWTFWHAVDSEDNLKHVYAYAGQRRGGRNYYALDLTEPGLNGNPNPKLLWQISDKNSGFSELGQTWSEPQLGKIRFNGEDVPVVVFAGGYDRNSYDYGRTATGFEKGNALYIVNAEDGSLIWKASNAGGSSKTYSGVPEMINSIPAAPALIDKNGDGYFDHIYVADLKGQVFRVDLNNGYNSTAGDGNNSVKLVERVNLLASLGEDKRFYSTPAVALGSDGKDSVITVVVGSGNRSNPLISDEQNSVFGVFDRWALGGKEVPEAITLSHEEDNLKIVDPVIDSTGKATVSTVGKGGWQVKLDASDGVREKSLSEAVIAANIVFFTTFTIEPNPLTDACSTVIGRSRLYAVDLTSGGVPEEGVPGAAFPSSRYAELDMVGIAPRPQILLNTLEAEDMTADAACNRTLSGVVGTHAFNIQSGNLCGLQRTGWFEASEEKADELLGIKQTSDEGGTE